MSESMSNWVTLIFNLEIKGIILLVSIDSPLTDRQVVTNRVANKLRNFI